MDKIAKAIEALDAAIEALNGTEIEASEELTERELIAAEIEELEAKLACGDDDDDDDDDDDEDYLVYMEDEELEMTAGVEDKITQDYLKEVEKEEKADMSDVSEVKQASERLDDLADILEASGRLELAHRIDELSDILDSE